LSETTIQTNQEMKTKTVPVGQLYNKLEDGRWEMFFDHHMISGFGKCEAYFELKHIQHWTPKGVIHLKTLLGQWWSKTMENYYTSLVAGDLTKDLACHIALEAWDDCKIDQGKALYPSTYEQFGGRAGAVAMIAQYFDFSYLYDSVHWKVVAIEAGFGRLREVKIGENNKVIVYYIGKPDLLTWEDGRLIPIDHKTKDYIQSNIVNNFKPHAQTAGYLCSGQVIADKLGLGVTLDRVIINVAARNEPSDTPRSGKKKPRFLRIPISYAQDELLEWKKQVVVKATRLRHCIENNEWLWNDAQCHVYSGCEYRPIHSRPPEVREIMKNAHYIQTEAWTPYEPEE
jgi:PD-(D/E)XK nuclease superfamily